MKILFTGGGSGGHFYPIVAVAAEVDKIAMEKRLLNVAKYYMASKPYDATILHDLNIHFSAVPAGKMRAYFSPLNILDMFKTAVGVVKAIFTIYTIFPDVIFGKGGFDSFPALLAAKIFRIPVVIHESDSVPGSVNRWAAKFAKRVAVGFPEAAEFFPGGKVAYTGTPVMAELHNPQTHGGREFLHLEENTPVILVLGGSQGAQIINESLMDALPSLLEDYQIIHQTGREHFKAITGLADVVLEKNPLKNRYHPFDYLNTLAMSMASGAADLIVARAGATTISEIALWGKPSILIPIAISKHDHQPKNAFNYARGGAAVVMEEKNLSPSIFHTEIKRILDNPTEMERMARYARAFARPDAAKVIASELLNIAQGHEV
jgi:UDP-N-acetylglucosamine--N-acetylmuramyl-(pentapeptide) pyrophosphoryl-undecaprenol N-acetylglucosamine transferase